jgi:hypothetical protein
MSPGIESSETLRIQVIALRKVGKTYAEIGTTLNLLPRTAQKNLQQMGEDWSVYQSP